MALDIDTLQFQEPIPGMSLTTEPKGRPWERPAKYSHPDDALEFYIQQLTVPKRIAQALEILELGFPLASLVDSIILNGVMQGLHSLDTGIIIAPAIFELFKGVADSMNIDYDDGLVHKNAPVDASLVATAIKQQRKRPEKQVQIEQEDIEKVEQAASLMEKPVRLKEPAESIEDIE